MDDNFAKVEQDWSGVLYCLINIISRAKSLSGDQLDESSRINVALIEMYLHDCNASEKTFDIGAFEML